MTIVEGFEIETSKWIQVSAHSQLIDAQAQLAAYLLQVGHEDCKYSNFRIRG